MSGFDKFMEKPYWKKFYNNIPTKLLKDYYKIKFDNNPMVCDKPSPTYIEDLKKLREQFTQVEWKYLYDNVPNQQAKAEYKKHLK